MTTLSANIDATQTLIPVDAALVNGTFQYPLHFTVGSEAIRVIGRAHESTWLVDRGIAGTTAATHLGAAALTRYYPDGATGAGIQTVSLLGPFAVTHATPNIKNPGVILGDIPAGANVIRAWAFFDDVFDEPGMTLNIYVSDPADISQNALVAEYNAEVGGSFGGEPWEREDALTDGPRIVHAIAACKLMVTTGTGTTTTGAARIYALIAEPA